MKFFRELKRRNVFKVGIAYAVTTWILLQLTDIISNIMELPEWAPKLILLILLIGFVPALIFAWAFEMTPDGLKLEKDVVRQQSVVKRTGRKLDYSIIILLGLSLAYFIWESRFEQKTEEYYQASQRIAEQQATPEPEVFKPVREIDPEDAEANENSIAVLPFTNRSADDSDLYFTDGVHDDLLTQLSKIDAFSVISRTSVMEYRDTTKNLKDIAKELSVANIMEGSVQRAGDRVRINVQLIDANTDEHLWAEIYDRELTTSNLFEIQSEIAQNIADALRATLTDSEKSTLAKAPTENLEAYDLYLQARQFTLGETRIGYQTALEMFKASIELDPGFALAWIGLGKAHITNYWTYGGDPADREQSRIAIDRAKEIDATVPELYMAEGFYWYWGHLDYDRALYNLERATELMPRNEEAHMWHGWASRRNGQWEQALRSFERSLELNPRVHFNWIEYGMTHVYLHRFDDAERALEKARELDINHFATKNFQSRLAMVNGDFGAAVRTTTGAQHSDEVGLFESYVNSRVLAHQFEEALEAAREMPANFEIQRQLILYRECSSAQILFYMGRKEEALEAARAGMFRLKGLRASVGDDYRILHAEFQMSPILGDSHNDIMNRYEKAHAAAPVDAVEVFQTAYRNAQTFGIAGMSSQASSNLDTLLSGPNEISVHIIDADPAFDSIREDPEFIAMMDRHR
jgi:TolB-like protein